MTTLAARLPECRMEVGYQLLISGKKIVGYIDAITMSASTVWELKCVSELTSEHLLQVAIYTLMHAVATQPESSAESAPTSLIYNIITDELLQVSAPIPILTKLVRALVHYKYHVTSASSDAEFIAANAISAQPATSSARAYTPCTYCMQTKEDPVVTPINDAPIIQSAKRTKRRYYKK